MRASQNVPAKKKDGKSAAKKQLAEGLSLRSNHEAPVMGATKIPANQNSLRSSELRNQDHGITVAECSSTEIPLQ